MTEEEIINKISSYIPGEHQIKFFIPCQRVGYLAQLQELKMADFENAFKVHVVSPLYLSQKLIPRLKQSTGKVAFSIDITKDDDFYTHLVLKIMTYPKSMHAYTSCKLILHL